MASSSQVKGPDGFDPRQRRESMKSVRTKSFATSVVLIACVGLVAWAFCGPNCALQCRYEEHTNCNDPTDHASGACNCCSDGAAAACGRSWIGSDGSKCMCAPWVGAVEQQPAVAPERIAQSDDFTWCVSALPDTGPPSADRVPYASIVSGFPKTLRSLRTVSLLL